jgi:hypothetical protein
MKCRHGLLRFVTRSFLVVTLFTHPLYAFRTSQNVFIEF